MYENIQGLIDVNSEPKLKIAIVGVPKAGKSWLGYTAPAPIFSFDFDTRSESLKEFTKKYKRTDIQGKTYWDKDPNIPNAMKDMEADIAIFEYDKSQGKEIPTTFILDSMTYMRVSMEHALIYQNSDLRKESSNFHRTIKIGNSALRIAQGWDIINGVRDYITYIVGRLSELGNVIAVFHEADETDKAKSTKETKAYTGLKTVQPVYLATVLSLFDHVFRVTLDYSGNRVVQAQPNSDFMAATTMQLDPSEAPNLVDMIAKHKAAIAK